MPITQSEFDTLLGDPDKWITGDLRWSPDEDHSPALVFKAEVESVVGYPILIRGRFNPEAGKLSFALLHRGTGRIYGLDLGADHHNPSCQMVGDLHKHEWTDVAADKDAYVPVDITAGVERPVEVWEQFCAEASIDHRGTLARPVIQQELGV
jgi:hypothetical protein